MDESQLLKGILEGSALSIISHGETYRYEILVVLEKHGFKDIYEGTLSTTNNIINAKYIR